MTTRTKIHPQPKLLHYSKLIPLMTSSGTTFLKELIKPRKALILFLLVGKVYSSTFLILLGSAITKSFETHHPRKHILVLANSHLETLNFACARDYKNVLNNCSI